MLTAVTDLNGQQIGIGYTADNSPNSVTLGSTRDTLATTYSATDAESAISLNAWGNPETTGGLAVSTPYAYAGGYTDATGLV